jgi:hypothetical protein
MMKKTLRPLLRSLNERHNVWLTYLHLTDEGDGQIQISPRSNDLVGTSHTASEFPGSSSFLVRWSRVGAYRGIIRDYAPETPDTDHQTPPTYPWDLPHGGVC